MATTPEQDRVKSLAESFSKRLTEIDTESERSFINDVVDQITEPPKRIPEPVFRELFMPYLLGEKTPTSNNDVLAHWVGLIGSASEPADIVNHRGDVLFQVPPIYDLTVVDSENRNKSAHNFATIFTEYADESKVHPAYGQRYLVEQLTKKAQTNLKTPEGTDAVPGSWLPILEHYHLVPKAGDAPTSTSKPVTEDDLDFED